MFFKLIRYDIKVGFASTLKRYLAALLLFPLMLLNFWLEATAVNNAALQNGDLQGVVRGSFGDLMLYTFGGMQKYIPEPGVAFQFPAFWMLLYLLLAYITLYYPFNDLEESGQNILVRSGGRRLWWFSKCIWNVSSVIVFFLLGWLVMLVGTLLMGGSMSMELSSGMQAVLRLNSSFYMSWVSSLALETMLQFHCHNQYSVGVELLPVSVPDRKLRDAAAQRSIIGRWREPDSGNLVCSGSDCDFCSSGRNCVPETGYFERGAVK